MWKRLLAAVVIGMTTLLVTRLWRAYPWPLAALSGASLGALVFASLQTIVRLRSTLAQYGPRPRSPEGDRGPDEATADSAKSPGAEPERHEQE